VLSEITCIAVRLHYTQIILQTILKIEQLIVKLQQMQMNMLHAVQSALRENHPGIRRPLITVRSHVRPNELEVGISLRLIGHWPC